jgi:hypothetical protein
MKMFIVAAVLCLVAFGYSFVVGSILAPLQDISGVVGGK